MPSFRFTAAVLGTPDPRGPGPLLPAAARLAAARTTSRTGPRCARPTARTGLSFQLEPDHVPPVWPPQPGAQQMQLHLDLEVDDLEAACALAEEAGARPLGGYEEAHEVVRVFADPAGHPFCLFTRS